MYTLTHTFAIFGKVGHKAVFIACQANTVPLSGSLRTPITTLRSNVPSHPKASSKLYSSLLMESSFVGAASFAVPVMYLALRADCLPTCSVLSVVIAIVTYSPDTSKSTMCVLPRQLGTCTSYVHCYIHVWLCVVVYVLMLVPNLSKYSYCTFTTVCKYVH